jgi:outer membrane protein TolC
VSSVGLSLGYTLFDGFNIQTNYTKLKELTEISKLKTKLLIENYIAELSSEYFNLVQQRLRLRNLISALELSRERLRIVEQRYNIGTASRLELSQASADFNTDNSRMLQQQLKVQNSCVALNNLISSRDLQTEIMCSDSVIVSDDKLNSALLLNNAMEYNTSLLLLKRNKELTNLDLEAIKSQNYPIIKIGAGYGYTHYSFNKGAYSEQGIFGFNAGINLE